LFEKIFDREFLSQDLVISKTTHNTGQITEKVIKIPSPELLDDFLGDEWSTKKFLRHTAQECLQGLWCRHFEVREVVGAITIKFNYLAIDSYACGSFTMNLQVRSTSFLLGPRGEVCLLISPLFISFSFSNSL
jgi:hypothetical protein